MNTAGAELAKTVFMDPGFRRDDGFRVNPSLTNPP
jgi:hypothetical protein